MIMLFSISHLCLSATVSPILLCLALFKQILNTVEHITRTPSQVGFHLCLAGGSHQQQVRKMEAKGLGVSPLLLLPFLSIAFRKQWSHQDLGLPHLQLSLGPPMLFLLLPLCLTSETSFSQLLVSQSFSIHNIAHMKQSL